MLLSAAQVWYIAEIRPEHITTEAIQLVYEEAMDQNEYMDRAYWETAAEVLNQMTGLVKPN